jgi:hypothetical protein
VSVAETQPVDWILPAVLLLTWCALWATRRRVSPGFFAAGVLLAVLCIPGGMLAGRAELAGAGCTPGNLCFSAYEVGWWANGILGFLTTGVLALATLAVSAVVAVMRSARDRTGAPR